MVTFDGDNKYIIVETDTVLSLLDIYSASKEWEDALAELVHHHVFDVSSELLFTLRYGWKFKPSGYAAGTEIKIQGKITTTEGETESKTVVATVGEPVTWQFDTPATVVLVPMGETVNVWHEPPTATEIASEVDALTPDDFIALSD